MSVISDDFASNLGLSGVIFGILLIIGAFFVGKQLLTPGIIMVVVGGFIYWIRNKGETEM